MRYQVAFQKILIQVSHLVDHIRNGELGNNIQSQGGIAEI
jgi:hypothetical protein